VLVTTRPAFGGSQALPRWALQIAHRGKPFLVLQNTPNSHRHQLLSSQPALRFWSISFAKSTSQVGISFSPNQCNSHQFVSVSLQFARIFIDFCTLFSTPLGVFLRFWLTVSPHQVSELTARPTIVGPNRTIQTRLQLPQQLLSLTSAQH